ncbi:MAG: YIP1 family protein [Elusimicrobiota bacterium]
MKDTAIVNQAENIIDIVFSPSKVFNKISRNSFWLLAYIFIAIGTIFFRILHFPFIKQIFLSSWPPEAAKSLIQSARSLTIISAALAPLYLILKFFIIAIILWLLVLLFTLETNFKKIFCLVVHCGIITFLGSILTILILYMRGLDSIESWTDIQISLGIDLFLGNIDLSLPFKTFLSNINLFSIWWIVLLMLGISIISNIPRIKSAFIAVFLWLFSTMFQVGIASIQSSLAKIG